METDCSSTVYRKGKLQRCKLTQCDFDMELTKGLKIKTKLRVYTVAMYTMEFKPKNYGVCRPHLLYCNFVVYNNANYSCLL